MRQVALTVAIPKNINAIVCINARSNPSGIEHCFQLGFLSTVPRNSHAGCVMGCVRSFFETQHAARNIPPGQKPNKQERPLKFDRVKPVVARVRFNEAKGQGIANYSGFRVAPGSGPTTVTKMPRNGVCDSAVAAHRTWNRWTWPRLQRKLKLASRLKSATSSCPRPCAKEHTESGFLRSLSQFRRCYCRHL